MNRPAKQIASLVLILLITCTASAQAPVEVEIQSLDIKNNNISIIHNGRTLKLALAQNVAITVEGKKTEVRWLLPGDTALLIYDKGISAVTSIAAQRAMIAPAEKIADGWDTMDDRLIFLMVRLASTEASLEAVENAIAVSNRNQSRKTGQAKQADKKNEDMDRNGGGPVKWSSFYGRTAESFFYHPTDRNTTYHTTTILSQQAPASDNQAAAGVPSRQGLPVHQRPPQFDYIYRANESAKARAEEEVAALEGDTTELIERRQRLEAEQAGLWCEIAFRAVSHYDLDKKPLYRFEPLSTDTSTEARLRAQSIKSAASFMALALSIVQAAEGDQETTFGKIKPAVAKARQDLNDTWLRIGIDVSDRDTTQGKFNALAKRLEESASNLSESYVVAIEGDLARDQQRKGTFRALLQDSLIKYAEVILALDEMASLMEDDWNIKPDVDKPIQFVSLSKIEANKAFPLPQLESASPKPAPPKTASPKPKVPKKENISTFQQLFRFGVEKEIKDDWYIRAADRAWSIENNVLKLTDNGSMVLRSTLDGDMFVEVVGYAQWCDLSFQLFGEKMNVGFQDKRPFQFRVMRKGGNLQFTVDGKQSSIQIKNAVSESPTEFSFSLESTYGASVAWISGAGIKASKAIRNDQ